MSEDNSFGAFVVGFTVGALAGAVALADGTAVRRRNLPGHQREGH